MTNTSAYFNTPILFSSLKWLAVVLIVLAWTNSWAEKDVQMSKPRELAKTVAVITPSPVTSPLTTFVDGPTGYVFVFTAEGWKFVAATKN